MDPKYYRAKLTNPNHYDRMVSLLQLHNSSCTNKRWAEDTIDICIRGALEGVDYATGGCMALRTTSGEVRLFLEPLFNL